jgi:hypothetical protein
MDLGTMGIVAWKGNQEHQGDEVDRVRCWSGDGRYEVFGNKTRWGHNKSTS